MLKVTFLTTGYCSNCDLVKEGLDELLSKYEGTVELESVDIDSDEGGRLLRRHQVMAMPGIIVDGELVSAGGLSHEKLENHIHRLVYGS